MFWDSSALVAALLDEPRSRALIEAFDADPVPVIWWGTPLECHAAVVRAVREKRVSREEATEAAERLREARTQVREVAPLEAVRTTLRPCKRATPPVPPAFASAMRPSCQLS
jgi:uncharacterized protein with PIN domain